MLPLAAVKFDNFTTLFIVRLHDRLFMELSAAVKLKYAKLRFVEALSAGADRLMLGFV